jgi:trk system potassium uptake protein
MKVLIMGCGRTGSQLASMLDAEGHKVTILDTNDLSFRRLPADFKGTALMGDGINDDTLIKAGIQSVDAFVAVTQKDNRNILAAQVARHIFKVPKVMLRIYDPLRREIYTKLGFETYSPTIIFAQLLKDNLMNRG